MEIRLRVAVPEEGHPFGEKVQWWFAAGEIHGVEYHPKQVVKKAIGKGQHI